MITRLTRSMLHEWGSAGGVALLAIVGLLFGLQIVHLAPALLRARAPLNAWFEAALLLMPAFLVAALPLAFLAGGLALFARWQRDGEWDALRAAGIGRRRLLAPTLLLCMLVSACVWLLANWAAPTALSRLERVIVDGMADGLNARLFENGVRTLGPDVHLIGWRAPGEPQGAALVLALGSGTERRILSATGGHFSGKGRDLRLLLKDGVWLDGEDSRIEFERLSVRLSDIGWPGMPKGLFAAHQSAGSGLLFDEWMSRGSGMDARRIGELSRRQAVALAVFVFGLTVSFAAGSRRLARAPVAYALAALLALSYYLLERLGMGLGERGVWPALLGPWLPLFLAALLLSLWWALGRRA